VGLQTCSAGIYIAFTICLLLTNKKGGNLYLSPKEVDIKQYLKNKLVEMLREEELKWYLQARVNELL